MTSQYRGVSFKTQGRNGRKVQMWIASTTLKGGISWWCYANSEREAAIAYDRKMIEIGKEPVNILKRKTQSEPRDPQVNR